MLRFVYAALLTAPILLAVDFLWIGVIARKYYQEGFGDHMAASFSIPPAVIFYIIYLAGLMIFVVYPAIVAKDLQRALIFGALFGFMCYMTYDFTNLATLKNWPVVLSMVDMAWGTLLATIASYFMYSIYFWIG